MIDEIGGVDQAIARAATLAGLKADSYDVRSIPAPRTLADLLNGTGSAEDPDARAALMPRVDFSTLPLLQALPPQTRSMLGEQLQILGLLQKHPVVLAAPFSLRVE